ncbi:DUF3618 domain-containing protein [Jannaschia sp. LMIT008]|uniref:DUF3618 domain-containing protein n=1 Tax=Jannaschia maritima TaxID=3032585 RepID=UPI0028122CF6|nr:DUF3618 domain-containing protein [Jannaschia sp. LMIT008]
MTDDRNPAEIEREIEAERHALADSLEQLQAQFSPERIVNQATGYFKDNGGEIAENLLLQVKRNPVAAGLVGVGLAWLMMAKNKPTKAGTYDRNSFTHDSRYTGSSYDGVGGRGSSYASDRSGRSPSVGYDDRTYPSAPGSLSQPTHAASDFDNRVEGATGSSDDGDTAWDSAKAKAGELSDKLSDQANDAKAGASDRWSSAKDGTSARLGAAREGTSAALNDWQGRARDRYDNARDGYAAYRARAYARSAELRARLDEGTRDMSDAARQRVLQARQAAAEAQEAMERKFGDYADGTREAYDQQPLIGGLIAAGIGAIVGASLPRTETEDRYLGQHRDRLFDEAERIFEEESANLKAVAGAALDEAKAVANEKVEGVKAKTDEAKKDVPSGDEAVKKAEGEARDAVNRVADAAKAKADEKGLGKSIN